MINVAVDPFDLGSRPSGRDHAGWRDGFHIGEVRDGGSEWLRGDVIVFAQLLLLLLLVLLSLLEDIGDPDFLSDASGLDKYKQTNKQINK